ncbi:MAG: MCE family protein [Paludibacteraceae bacterium]|nr:MCE family protein [Paludibacteraceae bacterium]
MKHLREIKVGLLAAVCLFLLFFGFNFLKGVNIFTPTNSYHGVYTHLHGLEEQAAVYIRGHKVGQVDAIHYDFTRDSAFLVDISIKKDIDLPAGTRMALVSDGMLGGMAIELQLPEQSPITYDKSQIVEKGSFLNTTYVPGLMESLQGELMAHVDQAVLNVDSLVSALQQQLSGDHLQRSLANVHRISDDLTKVSADMKKMMASEVPSLLQKADTAVSNLNTVVTDIQAANLPATVARVDTALDQVNGLLTEVRQPLQPLMLHLDAAVVSADSLLSDLKTHPKRYVHFSLFGKKNK